MNIAVILAGGTGSRMGADKPKQFLMLDGKMVIEHSINTFSLSPHIHEVAVVVHPQWLDFMRQLQQQRQWPKVRQIIPGGNERYMSSLHAIQAYAQAPADTNLILHDAARPWLSSEVVNRVVAALEQHPAVGVGIPSTDTVWSIDPAQQTISAIPPRASMWRAQTPQAFRLPLIAEAYRLALSDPHMQATDDCGVVLRYLPHTPIHIVPGEEQNRKITFKEDL
ncbi:MAG: 2-C-methyl-D-erythritol 4-phosphate cytidylyltransferase [Bacteroidales bacterium]|nr:2-C-methyl-D-erythritol 4-phosphate cytidylyltransferase [Bacteroidales bacterium]